MNSSVIDFINTFSLLLILYLVYKYCKNIFNEKDLFSIFASVSFVSGVTYVLGLFNFLQFRSIFNLVLSFLILRTSKSGFKRNEKSSGLLIFGFSILAWIKAVPEEFKFVNWDEFVSWGPNIKALTLEDSLYTNFGLNGSIGGGYKGYPPGQQIMQYLFTSTIGWSESKVILAQGILLLILVFFVVESELFILSWKRYFFVLPIISIFYLFGYSFTSIYADGLLAMFGLATYSMSKSIFLKGNKKQLYLLIPVYSILVLIKQIGFVIALLILFLSLIQSRDIFSINGRERGYSANKLKILMGNAIAPFIGITFAIFSWQLYISINSLETLRPSFYRPPNVKTTFLRFNETAEVFVSHFHSKEVYFSLPFSNSYISSNFLHLFIVMFLLQMVISIAFLKLGRGKEILVATFSTVACLIYLIFIFTLYVFGSDEYERKSGGSITRYIGTFVFIGLIILFLEFVKILRDSFPSVISLVFVLVLQIALPSGQMKSDLTHAMPNLDLLKGRMEIEAESIIAKKFASKGDRFYYIRQGDMGYAKNVFGYLVMPNGVNWWCWSVGNQVFEGDMWTCDKSVLSNLISYQFLVISFNDGQLKYEDIVSNRFSNKKGVLSEGVYRIYSDGTSVSSLKLLEEFI